MANLDPHLIRFLRPTGIQIPNGILIGSAVFALLMAESHYALQWASAFQVNVCKMVHPMLLD